MGNESGTSVRIAIHRVPGCYVAIALGVPGSVARGATEVEALENLRVAMRASLAIVRKLGNEKAIVELELKADEAPGREV